jgi:predicted ATP-grasp superfamily ATP-dependent carboligase
LRNATAHRITHIMGIEERDIPFLNWARSWLEPRITVLCPAPGAFSLALHKERTLELAREHGISVPGTVFPRNAGDLSECLQLRFPVVLKPKHRDTRDGWQPIFNLKSERIGNPEDLSHRLEEFARHEQLPMVQEFAPGNGVGVSVLMHKGTVQEIFQHRRIREWPPEGGVSVLCESVPLAPPLAEQSVALLRGNGKGLRWWSTGWIPRPARLF